MDHFQGRPPDEAGRVVRAHQPAEGPVGKGDPAVHVHEVRIRAEHDHLSVALLALAQGLPGGLLLGDVLDCARFAQRPALVVGEHLGDLADVTHGAVGTDNAVLEFHAPEAGRDRLCLPMDEGQVVGMHLAVEGFGTGGKVLPRDAEDSIDLVRPDQPVIREVVVPVAQGGDPLRIFEAALVEDVLVPVEPADLEQVAHAQQHLRELERRADEIPRAALQGGQLVAGLGRDREDGDVAVGFDLLQAGHHLEPVQPRHLQVEQDQVVMVPPMQFADLVGVTGRGDANVAGVDQDLLQQGDVGRQVVDDQDPGGEDVCGLGRHGGSGSDAPAGAVLPAKSRATSRVSMNSFTLIGLVR